MAKMNDTGVVVCIDRHGHGIHQTGQVSGPADFIQLAFFPENIAQRHQIHRFALGIERLGGGKDDFMGGFVEIIGRQDLENVDERAVIDQDGAEDRFLRLDALGRKFMECGGLLVPG